MRLALISLAAVLAGFQPVAAPPAEPTPPPVEAPSPAAPAIDAAAVEAARAALQADIGKPVSFAPEEARVDGDWAFLVGVPAAPDGAALDWSQTAYAEDAAEGALDGGGRSYVLLKRENGAWRALALAVGPTDVAWQPWPAEYGAPPALLGLAAAPQ